MTGSNGKISNSVRQFWARIKGGEATDTPAVVVHDPARRNAHNLDDPFFDDGVQSRIGDVIAGTGNRKTKNTY